MKRLFEIRSHCRILRAPILATMVSVIAWYFIFFPYHLNVGKADETALTNTLIPVLATFHAILAAAVLSKVWEEFKEIKRCIFESNEERFMECLQDRIPITIHLLLAVMSILIVLSAMLVEYQSACAGIAVVGGLTFVLTLYWEVATNLDNPISGVWYIDQIPPEWLRDK